MHDSFIHVVNHSELFELRGILNHVLLDLLHLIVQIVVNLNGIFIGIIIEINETVIQEESAVAFFAIAIINLLTPLNVIESFNNESSSIISIVPCSLSWSLMIEHVCIGNKPISFDTFYLDAENTT